MSWRILKVVALLLVLDGCGHQPEARQPDAAAQQHIRELASTLPPGTQFRDLLDHGWYGDGIHEPWMDEMQKLHVKGAMLEVYGTWVRPLSVFNPSVRHVMYFSSYAGPDAQITDPAILQRIRESGLEHTLKEVALHRANGKVHVLDNPKFKCAGCFAQIFLVDDEWLDRDYLTLTEYVATTPLLEAARLGDQIETAKLLEERNINQSELDGALFAAVTQSWDNTGVIKLLLKRGASVNTRRSDGSTPLMKAASYNDLNAVKLLLEAGADPNLKDEDGETALSIVECSSCLETVKKDSDYSPELVELLRQASRAPHSKK